MELLASLCKHDDRMCTNIHAGRKTDTHKIKFELLNKKLVAVAVRVPVWMLYSILLLWYLFLANAMLVLIVRFCSVT